MAISNGKGLFDRWQLILQTTPSGKAQFVCLICGVCTSVPNTAACVGLNIFELDEILSVPCHTAEQAIREGLATREDLVLAQVNNELRGLEGFQCRHCLDHGCAHCPSATLSLRFLLQNLGRTPER